MATSTSDRAGSHRLDHVFAHQPRRAPAGHEHGADQQIGVGDGALDRPLVRREREDPALVDLVDPPQPIDVLVEQDDLGLHARRDPRRVPADVAGAEHDDPAGAHAGRAAEQDAATAARLLEVVRARLGRHASGDLAHGCEQRQRSVGGLHGLVRDGRAP